MGNHDSYSDSGSWVGWDRYLHAPFRSISGNPHNPAGLPAAPLSLRGDRRQQVAQQLPCFIQGRLFCVRRTNKLLSGGPLTEQDRDPRGGPAGCPVPMEQGRVRRGREHLRVSHRHHPSVPPPPTHPAYREPLPEFPSNDPYLAARSVKKSAKDHSAAGGSWRVAGTGRRSERRSNVTAPATASA